MYPVFCLRCSSTSAPVAPSRRNTTYAAGTTWNRTSRPYRWPHEAAHLEGVAPRRMQTKPPARTVQPELWSVPRRSDRPRWFLQVPNPRWGSQATHRLGTLPEAWEPRARLGNLTCAWNLTHGLAESFAGTEPLTSDLGTRRVGRRCGLSWDPSSEEKPCPLCVPAPRPTVAT